MKTDRHRRRPRTLLYSVLALCASGLSLPFLFGDAARESTLHTPQVRAETRGSFTLSGPVTLLQNPGLVVERGVISVTAEQSEVAPNGEALDRTVKSGQAHLVLTGARIVVDPGIDRNKAIARIGGARDADGAVAPLLGALARLKFASLSLRDTVIAVKGADGLPLSLGRVDATVSTDRKQLVAKGTLDRDGQSYAFETTLGLHASKKLGYALPASARIISDMLSARFDGHFLPGTGTMFKAHKAELEISKLEDLAPGLALRLPDAVRPETFAAAGHMVWTGTSVTFDDATFQIDGNEATGRLTLNFAAARPAIDGTLAFGRLEIGRYLASAGETAATRVLGYALPWISDLLGGMSSSAFGDFDADVRISAEELTASETSLGSGAATLTLDSGKLLADIAEFKLGSGGQGNAQIGIDLNGWQPRYVLRGQIDGLDLARVDKLLLGGRKALAGPVTLTLDLTAAGRTLNEIAASLDGRAAAKATEPTIIGIDVPALVAAAAGSTLTGWDAAGDGASTLDEIELKIVATSGIATTEMAVARSGAARMTAAGTVNLRDQNIDLQVSRVDDWDGEGTIPQAADHTLHIQGSWSRPTIHHLGPSNKADSGVAPAGERGG